LAVIVATFVFFLVAAQWPSLKNRAIPIEHANFWSKESLDVIRVIWVEWGSVLFTFALTMALFPGYVCGIRQPHKLGDWIFLLITTVFSVFDWIGRYLPSHFRFPSRKYVFVPVVCRLIFVPIFVLSIQGVFDLNEPWWTLAWMAPFALTNGYGGTVSLIYGSTNEGLSMSQRKYAGLLVSFAVNAGLLLAMGLTFAMPRPNPIPFG
jgi:equilibrative nucleoside transporter 1/2/3